MMASPPQTVLVTGASTGIGRATALELVRRGFCVFAGVRTAEDGERLQEEVKQQEVQDDRLIPVLLDVTALQTIEAAVRQVEGYLSEHQTQLRGVVNNAGIVVAGPLEFLSVKALSEQLNVNVLGQLAVTQAFLPLLRQSKGRLVMMSSIAAMRGLPFIGPYCASKSALEALSDALRIELKPAGIQVAIIQPGSILTPIWEKSLAAAKARADGFPPEAAHYYGEAYARVTRHAAQSNRRGVAPERVAAAVLHALTAAKPKTRYRIGGDAEARRLFCRLPDGLTDALIAWRLGM